MRSAAIPPGFVAVGARDGLLIVAEELRSAVEGAGLDHAAGWSDRLGVTESTSGRGATARVVLASGDELRIKKMRRGGLVGALWRDRYLGRRRLLAGLRVADEARRRGIPTPRPVAMLLVGGPSLLFQAWVASAEVRRARDLTEWLASSAPPTRDELAAVARALRSMHDRGLEHRDLNLGNLLLRRRPAPRTPEVFVIDLDRARLHPAALSLARRQRALRRLERSTAKLFGDDPVGGIDLRDVWYREYAAGDRRLARQLERARRRNRVSVMLHRWRWRGGGGRAQA